MLYIHDNDLPSDIATKADDIIGVDTETTGLNPMRDRLCLVQISLGEDVHIVRMLGGESPTLVSILENEKILKIFHYAGFDIGFLSQGVGADVRNFECTKIMSKLARTYTDRHGLKDLCAELLDVELNKGLATSYWGEPEYLTPDQLEYAANDVIHLRALRDILWRRLETEGRTELAKQAFKAVVPLITLRQHGFDNSVLMH